MYLRLLISCFFIFTLFADEEELLHFTADQLATLTSDASQLIGGVVSPLSGNVHLQKTDFVVQGAEPLALKRVYVAPYMPTTFHKYGDRDNYYRALHVLCNYEGWKCFPHRKLTYNTQTGQMRITLPNGAVYDFTLQDKPTLLSTYAVSNWGGGDLPSGQYDPRNIQIAETERHFVITTADGFTRYYTKDSCYLEKEQLPNGKVRRYSYRSTFGKLCKVETFDPQERYCYSAIEVEENYLQHGFTGTTGAYAFYNFSRREARGHFREGKTKRKYYLTLPPILTSVTSSLYKEECQDYLYNAQLLTFTGKEQIFDVEYAPFGLGDKSHLKVAKFYLPDGQASALLYQMEYDPPIAGEKEGLTKVVRSDGITIHYHYSKELLPTSIQYFDETKELTKETLYCWDKEQRLRSVESREGAGNTHTKRSYLYDSFGNPIEESVCGDLPSYTIKREFSERNLLVKEIGAEGTITTYSYLPNTNLVTTKCIYEGDKLLIQENYLYDDCYNLLEKSVGDDTGQKRIVRYSLRKEQPFLHMAEWVEKLYVEEEQERLLSRTHLIYDSFGNVVEERVYDAENAYAYTIYKEYDEAGNLLSETTPEGKRVSYKYDARGRIIEKSGRCTEILEYDVRGNQLAHIEIGEKELHHTTYAYDALDHLIEERDHFGHVTTYEVKPYSEKCILPDKAVTTATYDVFGRVSTKTDANGRTTHYRYNAFDKPTSIVHPNGSEELYTYTKEGRVASHKDQEGLTTYYSYDILGRVTCKEYEGIGKESFTYDSFHLTSKTDLEGYVTTFSYDGAGRKIAKEKCGRKITYGYDSLGYLSTLRQDDLITHYKNDREGRLVEESKKDITGKLLTHVRYTYTEEGELATITRYLDGRECVESYSYDSFGRRVATIEPNGASTTILYDDQCPKITTVDPQGNQTVVREDAFGRLLREEKFDAQRHKVAEQERSYDPEGNLTDWIEYVYEGGRCTDRQHTHYSYSTLDKPDVIFRAYGTQNERATHYSYTLAGKVAGKKLPSGTTLFYAYDQLGYLADVTSSDGTIDHSFLCNKKGQLLEASDRITNISIKREIDPFGNVTREEFPNEIVVCKEYDTFDRVTSLTIPQMGTITYAYDPLFLRKVSRYNQEDKLQYSHQYKSYDLGGNLLVEKMILGAGEVAYRLDKKGRKKAISSSYLSQEFAYDKRGNLTEQKNDDKRYRYSYDALSQITSANEKRYSCNSLFNCIEKGGRALATNNLNELEKYPYDVNGNLLGKEGVTYRYDALGRLVEVTLENKRIAYSYDPLGRRLTKSSKAKEEHYLYDGIEEIGALTEKGKIKECRVLGAALAEGRRATVAVELGQNRYAPLLDFQGNITGLVDPKKRKLTSRYEYSVFGEEEVRDKNPWRYGGKRKDFDTGLIYYGKRDYDPTLCRWLTMDPMGFIDGMNPYQFALNNPFTYYDPDGEIVFSLCIPFTTFFTPSVWALAAKAIAAGVGLITTYVGGKYVVDHIPLDGIRDAAHEVLDNAFGMAGYALNKRSKPKNREKKQAPSAEDLENDPDWDDISHTEEIKNGHRTFENKKTGERIRYDKGKPGKPGHGAHDHYHKFNPKAPKGKKGDNIRYLDKDGNPVAEGSGASHLYPPEGTTWNWD